MANEISTIDSSAPVVVTETRFSTSMLMAEVPSWVDWRALAAITANGYGRPIPAGAVEGLTRAAALYDAAMAPSRVEDRHSILMGLRSATIIRDEDVAEADATLKLLRTHLADVPVDILREACRAYCNAQGRRFFPRSAGELRTFTNPLMFQRRMTAMRLQRLAREAERADRERAREAERITPEQFKIGMAKINAIMGGARPSEEGATG